jgi:hypothetical protein
MLDRCYGFLVIILALPNYLHALEPLSENDMQSVLGQGGVYLSGDITINETGGPLNDTTDASNPAIWQKGCSTSASSTEKRCGARLAVNAGDDGTSGWLVLDNIRGRFSFEGLTLRTRTITDGFGGDGAGVDGNGFGDVLELGLPNTVKYSDVTFTLANSNRARPEESATGFRQTNIFDVRINGDVTMQGNLLIFPTGNP